MRQACHNHTSHGFTFHGQCGVLTRLSVVLKICHSRHIDIQHFAIQDWAAAKDIVMRHIPGILSIPDGLTKALGWVLHSRHARRMMGHFLNSLAVAPILLI